MTFEVDSCCENDPPTDSNSDTKSDCKELKTPFLMSSIADRLSHNDKTFFTVHTSIHTVNTRTVQHQSTAKQHMGEGLVSVLCGSLAQCMLSRKYQLSPNPQHGWISCVSAYFKIIFLDRQKDLTVRLKMTKSIYSVNISISEVWTCGIMALVLYKYLYIYLIIFQCWIVMK